MPINLKQSKLSAKHAQHLKKQLYGGNGSYSFSYKSGSTKETLNPNLSDINYLQKDLLKILAISIFAISAQISLYVFRY